MADLPYSLVKINDVEVAQDAPLTEALFKKLGGTMNYLLDKQFAITTVEFTSSGSWLCPAGVTKVFLQGCGGGGGGSSSTTDGVNASWRYSGHGGGAAPWEHRFFDVTPGNTYTVTVGAGGAGGNWVNFSGDGNDGTGSAFGAVQFIPGKGARLMRIPNNTAYNQGPGPGGGNGVTTIALDIFNNPVPGTGIGGYGGAGRNGNAGGYTPGGTANNNGANGQANTGAGGGGAGGSRTSTNTLGGNGGSGIVIVTYWVLATP